MSLNRKKILIADDDSDDLDFIKEVISQIDNMYEIDTVNNGEQVLQYLSNCSGQDYPCLIILDYKMPLMNAAELLENMKDGELYPEIPKVVWSTSMENEHVNRCMNAGALQYFSKPSKASELKAVAKTMLDICHETERLN